MSTEAVPSCEKSEGSELIIDANPIPSLLPNKHITVHDFILPSISCKTLYIPTDDHVYTYIHAS